MIKKISVHILLFVSSLLYLLNIIFIFNMNDSFSLFIMEMLNSLNLKEQGMVASIIYSDGEIKPFTLRSLLILTIITNVFLYASLVIFNFHNKKLPLRTFFTKKYLLSFSRTGFFYDEVTIPKRNKRTIKTKNKNNVSSRSKITNKKQVT